MAFTISRRTLAGAALASPLLFLSTPASGQNKLSIATSMPLLQDIVANVAGDAAEVFSMMPANADPHTWEARPEDMVKLTDASGFVFNGALLEPFVESGGWRRAVRDAGVQEFAVTDHVDLIEVDQVIDHGDHSHDLHGGDPHIWLDPLTIVEAVPAIASWLGELDPDNADTYAANGDTYVVEIEGVHTSLEESFAAIPAEHRKLLVFHDAWRYFAVRYHFEIVGVVLENPDSEMSAQEMVDLLKVVEDSGVNVIFAEPQFNTSVLDVLSAEGDVQIATLLTDSFADDVTTYLGLLEFNRDQIVRYLGA